nr:MAG TPA: hypothetical protein [Caudoviricetes sp.]
MIRLSSFSFLPIGSDYNGVYTSFSFIFHTWYYSLSVLGSEYFFFCRI